MFSGHPATSKGCVYESSVLVGVGSYVLWCVKPTPSSIAPAKEPKMLRSTSQNRLIGLLCVVIVSTQYVHAQQPAGPPKNDPDQAKAAFQAKFDDYKAAIREIEKLQSEYQTADEPTREKLNTTMASQVTHAQSLVNAMVEAAEAAYRAAPNSDKQITDLLIAVARHYTIGRQTGPGQAARDDPEDTYYPIDGGDQYERALPIIKLLIDGGAENTDLFVWGFLCAFMTNDYDLAETYLTKAKETGAIDAIAMTARRDDRTDPQAGLMKSLLRTVTTCAQVFDEYHELWKKESAIRAAEAKADDLPRVKLTTTKGEITLELFENEAPQSVANFLSLVKQGFYNGSPFHRVLPEFMAQGGAKTDDGNGGPGYTIRDETNRPDYRRHFRGSLSMAKTRLPDSGNSQFFLTFTPTPHLNGRHTAFGRVIEGMEVLGDLQHRSPQHEANPPKPDRILKAEVVRERAHEYKFDRLGEK
jgi:cyclophilin family peptidyl-prolyl cis-trans isomerase